MSEKYNSKLKVSKETYYNSNIDNEFIEREVIYKLISQIPINELKKYFNFTVFDPFSKENREMYNNPFIDKSLRDKFVENYLMETVEFDVSLTI